MTTLHFFLLEPSALAPLLHRRKGPIQMIDGAAFFPQNTVVCLNPAPHMRRKITQWNTHQMTLILIVTDLSLCFFTFRLRQFPGESEAQWSGPQPVDSGGCHAVYQRYRPSAGPTCWPFQKTRMYSLVMVKMCKVTILHQKNMNFFRVHCFANY